MKRLKTGQESSTLATTPFDFCGNLSNLFRSIKKWEINDSFFFFDQREINDS